LNTVTIFDTYQGRSTMMMVFVIRI